MKKTAALIFLFPILLNSFSSTAQSPAEKFAAKVAERMKKRAAQRAEDNVMDRADRGVDKVVDGFFGKVDKGAQNATVAAKEAASGSDKEKDSSSDKAENNPLGMLGGIFGNSPAPEANYSFNSSYIMKIISKDKKESTTMRSKYYFSSTANLVGMKFLESSNPEMKNQGQAMEAMVIDFENNTMFTFMNVNEQKTMMAISLNSSIVDVANDKTDKSLNETTYTKTNQTKTIAGYTCDSYLMKDNDTESTVWISRTAVPVVSKYYESFQKAASSNKNNKLAIDYKTNDFVYEMMTAGRALLGMTTREKNGNYMEMEVEEVNANDNYSLSTAGYQNMMDFGKIMQDAENQSTED